MRVVTKNGIVKAVTLDENPSGTACDQSPATMRWSTYSTVPKTMLLHCWERQKGTSLTANCICSIGLFRCLAVQQDNLQIRRLVRHSPSYFSMRAAR